MVNSGSLGFTVMLYTGVALIGIAILMFRRTSSACGRAELGGPNRSKRVSAMILILLWVLYVTMSSLQAYGMIVM